MNPWYKEYSVFLQELFPDTKVQKISVNAGCTCPNRDGTISHGGCIYCDNSSFSPAYTLSGTSIKEQISEGKRFFARKYPQMKYLAYFQNFSGTYGDRSRLLGFYREALEADGIAGIIISTRPDCIDSGLLHEIRSIAGSRPVIMEYGAETSHDSTLRLINRRHTWEDVENAVALTAEAGLHAGIHLINFLPGEEEKKILETVGKAIALPLSSIKFHHLQIIRATPLHRMTESGDIQVPEVSLERYIGICAAIVRMIPSGIAIERFTSQAPPGMVVAPSWGIKNYQFVNLLHNYLKQTQKKSASE